MTDNGMKFLNFGFGGGMSPMMLMMSQGGDMNMQKMLPLIMMMQGGSTTTQSMNPMTMMMLMQYMQGGSTGGGMFSASTIPKNSMIMIMNSNFQPVKNAELTLYLRSENTLAPISPPVAGPMTMIPASSGYVFGQVNAPGYDETSFYAKIGEVEAQEPTGAGNVKYKLIGTPKIQNNVWKIENLGMQGILKVVKGTEQELSQGGGTVVSNATIYVKEGVNTVELSNPGQYIPQTGNPI
ncbi:MAG: hypothetical protein ABEI78_00630, partial [Candidatus Nanohaloarchaea archaeon]